MPSDEKKQLIAEMKSELVVTMKAMQLEMEVTVEKKIDSTVNGKINDLRRAFDDHQEKVDAFIGIMTPAVDGIRTLVTLRRFAVWLSGFGILGTILWIGVKGLLGR